MKTEHFLSATYIPDPEDLVRHQLVAQLCQFFGSEAVVWNPELHERLSHLASELTDSIGRARKHFNRMYFHDLRKLDLTHRRMACDLVLQAIGLDHRVAEQFLLTHGWARVCRAMDAFCTAPEQPLRHGPRQ